VSRSFLPVLIHRLDRDLPLPGYAHPGDAGMDIFARQTVEIAPLGRVTVPTGIALAIPDGYVASVRPRSGLAAHHGVTVLNTPGTVDAGYRGEIAVTLINTDSQQAVTLSRGDRIAQIVFQKFEQAELVEVDRLPGSVRGAGGFGSTG
jgi:dUTP pyrophosphatase